MSLSPDLVRRCFEQVVRPARLAGWWIELDYQENERLLICANHPTLENRLFHEHPARLQDSLSALRQWFQECAYLLYQQPSQEAAQRLADYLARQQQ